MSKIPFTLDAWLKDKSQKIETRNGRPVHYIGLDRAGWQVFEVFRTNGTSEYRTYHDSYLYSGPGESTFDLFIVTPEPELSEFEKKLSDVVGYAISLSVAEPQKPTSEFVKEYAVELLSLAREQFIKDGYVIEKKAFHDAAEKVSTEVMKEVSENVDKANEELTEFEESVGAEIFDPPFNAEHVKVIKEESAKLLAVAEKEIAKRHEHDVYIPEDTYYEQLKEQWEHGYDKGKTEALKDLPRWKKCQVDDPIACVNNCAKREDSLLYYNGHTIKLIDLEKLPGFKED